jgi:hypothetical protein
MSFNLNSDFNFNSEIFDTKVLDKIYTDHVLKEPIFKLTDFFNILKLDEKF